MGEDMNSTTTRIMIVDDHPAVREGLKTAFMRDNRFTICAEAGSCKDALSAVRLAKPAVALVDVSLPDGSGILLVPQLLEESHGELGTIVLSMYTRVDYIIEAYTAGARGYLSKTSHPDLLLTAVRLVNEGEYFFDGIAVREIFQALTGAVSVVTGISDPAYGELTSREKEVLQLILAGRTNRQIAGLLNISIRTVENHRASIMRKVGVHSPVDLYQYAVRIGLVEANGLPR
jgi:DNA-binding NarL/FixJ family response regulator